MTSWFNQAGILVADGVWDNSTLSLYLAHGKKIELKEETLFPHSLGLLYTLFTIFVWFEPNEWEYKMMWLASYGTPIYLEKIKKIATYTVDGNFTVDTSYVNFTSFTSPFTKKFLEEFWYPRKKWEEISQYNKDISASIQFFLEEYILFYCEKMKQKYWFENFCFSGWVALNCKLNGEIYKRQIFKNVYIPSNPGDGGSSMGAVLYGRRESISLPQEKDVLFTGFDIDDFPLQEEMKQKFWSSWERFEKHDIRLFQILTDALFEDHVIAICQWKAEFWPRALGNRSILASPLHESIKEVLNQIKGREYFRPFAPMVMKKDFPTYFSGNENSRAMMYLSDVISKDIPWVTHFDTTARVQVIEEGENYFIEQLLTCWKEKTGHGVLVNTSFNKAGDVIVNDIGDALETLKKTSISYLVIGFQDSFYLIKKAVNEKA